MINCLTFFELALKKTIFVNTVFENNLVFSSLNLPKVDILLSEFIPETDVEYS